MTEKIKFITPAKEIYDRNKEDLKYDVIRAIKVFEANSGCKVTSLEGNFRISRRHVKDKYTEKLIYVHEVKLLDIDVTSNVDGAYPGFEK